MVASADPIHAENCGGRVSVGGCPQRVSDAIHPSPGRQCALKWCAFLLELLRKLFRKSPSDLRIEDPVAMPRTPPSGLANAVKRAPIKTSAISPGSEACAKLEAASKNRLNVSASSLVGPSAWTWGRSPRGTLQTVHENFPVQLNRKVWTALQHFPWDVSLNFLRAPRLQLLESGVIARSQCIPRQTLTGSCHFSHLNSAARRCGSLLVCLWCRRSESPDCTDCSCRFLPQCSPLTRNEQIEPVAQFLLGDFATWISAEQHHKQHAEQLPTAHLALPILRPHGVRSCLQRVALLDETFLSRGKDNSATLGTSARTLPQDPRCRQTPNIPTSVWDDVVVCGSRTTRWHRWHWYTSFKTPAFLQRQLNEDILKSTHPCISRDGDVENALLNTCTEMCAPPGHGEPLTVHPLCESLP